mmetsp:Transcript_3651/g.5617  ORF Transcript_3651/g.5617 Transcript_3651/m.5617 type:complete len:158 (-) Transcript_3651:83-556(-)
MAASESSDAASDASAVEDRKRTPNEMAALKGLLQYLRDEEFQMEVAHWAFQHCNKFPRTMDPEDWEHPLELTTLHKEYRELFESRAEAFMTDTGFSKDKILAETKELFEEEREFGEPRGLFDAITASEDYLAFCRYMQMIRTRRDWAEGKTGYGYDD